MFNYLNVKMPLDLSTEFKYTERGIVVPDRSILQKVVPINFENGKLEAGAIELNNSFGQGYYKKLLVDSGVEDIKYDIFVLIMPKARKAYAAITSIKGEGDSLMLIGFRDFSVKYEVNNTYSTGSGNILSQLTPISGDENVKKLLYPQIRESTELEDDIQHSFVILENFRGNDYGKHLFFTGLELASLLGSEIHVLTQDGTLNKMESGKSYYDKYSANAQFKLRA